MIEVCFSIQTGFSAVVPENELRAILECKLPSRKKEELLFNLCQKNNTIDLSPKLNPKESEIISVSSEDDVVDIEWNNPNFD